MSRSTRSQSWSERVSASNKKYCCCTGTAYIRCRYCIMMFSAAEWIIVGGYAWDMYVGNTPHHHYEQKTLWYVYFEPIDEWQKQCFCLCSSDCIDTSALYCRNVDVCLFSALRVAFWILLGRPGARKNTFTKMDPFSDVILQYEFVIPDVDQQLAESFFSWSRSTLHLSEKQTSLVKGSFAK